MAENAPLRTGRVGPVDSLRCFAMTAVVAQHCGLLPFGWAGVWLFFAISGYVVTLSVIGRPAESAWPGLMAFYRRRFLRILPVYYLYVGLGLLFMMLIGVNPSTVALKSLLGFYNNMAMIFGQGELAEWPVGHLWTISVEMQFYVVYGIALFVLDRRHTIMLLLCMLVIAPVLRLAVSSHLQQAGWTDLEAAYAIYAGSFLHVDSFALGALLAFANKRGLLGQISRPLAAMGAGVLLIYLSAYIHINHVVLARTGIDMFRDIVSGVLFGQYREVFLYAALAFAAVGLISLAATEDRITRWILRFGVFRRIGEISYGAYVFHAAAIVLAAYLLDRLPGLPMETGSTGFKS